jgi:uncharacterized cupredoxin-like copper-binding protein
MSVKLTKPLLAIAAAVTLATSGTAFAAEGHGHGHAQTVTIGEPGRQSKVSRTIEIVMGDNYFEPEALTVHAGETIRFVVRNEGEFLHEFNVGTAAMHSKHQEEMMAMMEQGMLTATGIERGTTKMGHTTAGMSGHAHDDPNSVLVEPEKTQELVWKFAAATNLEFACNLPGHYEAGMVGEIKIHTRPQTAKGS